MIGYNIDNYEIPKEVFNKKINKSSNSQLFTVSKLTFSNLENVNTEVFEKGCKIKPLVNKSRTSKKKTTLVEAKSVKNIVKSKEGINLHIANNSNNFIKSFEAANVKNDNDYKTCSIKDTLVRNDPLYIKCDDAVNVDNIDNTENAENVESEKEDSVLTSNMFNPSKHVDFHNNTRIIKKKNCELKQKIDKKCQVLPNAKKIDNKENMNNKKNVKIMCQLKKKLDENKTSCVYDSNIAHHSDNNYEINNNYIKINKNKIIQAVNDEGNKKVNSEYTPIRNKDSSSSNLLNEKISRRRKLNNKIVKKKKPTSMLLLNSNKKKCDSNYASLNSPKKKPSFEKRSNSKINNIKKMDDNGSLRINNNIEKKKKKKIVLNKNVKSKHTTTLEEDKKYQVSKIEKKRVHSNNTKKKKNTNNKKLFEKKSNTKRLLHNLSQKGDLNMITYDIRKNANANSIKKHVNSVKKCINEKKKETISSFNNEQSKLHNNEIGQSAKYIINNAKLNEKNGEKSKGDTHIYTYLVKSEDDKSLLNFGKLKKEVPFDNEYEMNLSKFYVHFKNEIENNKEKITKESFLIDHFLKFNYNEKMDDKTDEQVYMHNLVSHHNGKENRNIVEYGNYNNNLAQFDKTNMNILHYNSDYMKQMRESNPINYNKSAEYINEHMSNDILDVKRAKSLNCSNENKCFNSLIVTNDFRIKMCYSNSYLDFKKLSCSDIYEEKKSKNDMFIKTDNYINSSNLFLISIDSDKTRSNNLQQKRSLKLDLSDLNDFGSTAVGAIKEETFHKSSVNAYADFSDPLGIDRENRKEKGEEKDQAEEEMLNSSNVINANIFEKQVDESNTQTLAAVDKKNNIITVLLEENGNSKNNCDNSEKDSRNRPSEICDSGRNLYTFKDTENTKLCVNNVISTNECALPVNFECGTSSLANTSLKSSLGSGTKDNKQIKKKKGLYKKNVKKKCDKKTDAKNSDDSNTCNSIVAKKKHSVLLDARKINIASPNNLKKKINRNITTNDHDNTASEPLGLSAKEATTIEKKKKKKKGKKKEKNSSKITNDNAKVGSNLTNDCEQIQNTLSWGLNNEIKQKVKLVKKANVNNQNNSNKDNEQKIKYDSIDQLVVNKSSSIVNINLKLKKKKQIINQCNYFILNKSDENDTNVRLPVIKNNKGMTLYNSLEDNEKNKHMALNLKRNNEHDFFIKNVDDKMNESLCKNKFSEKHSNMHIDGKRKTCEFSILKLSTSKKIRNSLKIEKKKRYINCLKRKVHKTSRWSKGKQSDNTCSKRKLLKKTFGKKVIQKNNLKKYNFVPISSSVDVRSIRSNSSNVSREIVSIECQNFKNKRKGLIPFKRDHKNNEKNTSTNENFSDDVSCFKNVIAGDNHKDASDNLHFSQNIIKSNENKQTDILNICCSNKLPTNYIERSKEKNHFENCINNRIKDINLCYKKNKQATRKRYVINHINIKKDIQKVHKKKNYIKISRSYLYDTKKKRSFFVYFKKTNPMLIKNTFNYNFSPLNDQHASQKMKNATICDLGRRLKEIKSLVVKEQGYETKLGTENINSEKKLNQKINSNDILNIDPFAGMKKSDSTFLKSNNSCDQIVEHNSFLENDIFFSWGIKNNLNMEVHRDIVSLKQSEECSGSMHEKTVEDVTDKDVNKKVIVRRFIESSKQYFGNSTKSHLSVNPKNENFEKLHLSNYENNIRHKSENLNSNIKSNSFSRIHIDEQNCATKKETCYSLTRPIHTTMDNIGYNSGKKGTTRRTNNSFFTCNKNVLKNKNDKKIKTNKREMFLQLNEFPDKSFNRSFSISVLNLKKIAMNNQKNEIRIKKIALKNNMNKNAIEKKEINEKLNEEKAVNGIKNSFKSKLPINNDNNLWHTSSVNVKKVSHDILGIEKSNFDFKKCSQQKEEKNAFKISEIKDESSNKIYCSNLFVCNTTKQGDLHKSEVKLKKTITLKQLLSNKIEKLKENRNIFRSISMNNAHKGNISRATSFSFSKKNNNINKMNNKKRSNSIFVINTSKPVSCSLSKTKSLICVKNSTNDKCVGGSWGSVYGINKYKDTGNIGGNNSNALKLHHDKADICSFNTNNKNIYKKKKERIFVKNNVSTNGEAQRNKSICIMSNNILKNNTTNNFYKTDALYNQKIPFLKRIKSLTLFKDNEKDSSNLARNIGDNNNFSETKNIEKHLPLLNNKLRKKSLFVRTNSIKNSNENKNSHLPNYCYLFESTLKNDKSCDNRCENNINENINKRSNTKTFSRYRSYTSLIYNLKNPNNKKTISIGNLF